MNSNFHVAIVIPIGPGKDAALDTLESVEAFCSEGHQVIIVDDQTEDGTYEALVASKRVHWRVFRNARCHGVSRLVHTLCFAYEQALHDHDCKLVLRLDQDALLIKEGLLPEAITFMNNHPAIGMFGVYDVDYNRPRNFESHQRLFNREIAWYRRLLGCGPSWLPYLKLALANGYELGENVFGGAYFITSDCLLRAKKLGALNVPWDWHSKMEEDVYFSMITVAAGYRLGHFAAPDGPLCMEWRGLPFPAMTLASSKYKLVHSVDKGPNSGPRENGGMSAREVFRALRPKVSASDSVFNHKCVG